VIPNVSGSNSRGRKYRSIKMSIADKRAHIYHQMVSRLGGDPNAVDRMTDDNLFEMIRLYDDLFLDGQLLVADPKIRTRFGNFGFSGQYGPFAEYGKEVDSSGISGHTLIDDQHHTVLISRPIFTSLFKECHRSEYVNGIACRSQLECLQLTVEHELCHLILNIWSQELYSAGRGHGQPFQALSSHLFGHTHYQHWLGRCLGDDPDTHIRSVRATVHPGDVIHIYNNKNRSRDQFRVANIAERVTGTNLDNGQIENHSLIDVILPNETS